MPQNWAFSPQGKAINSESMYQKLDMSRSDENIGKLASSIVIFEKALPVGKIHDKCILRNL